MSSPLDSQQEFYSRERVARIVEEGKNGEYWSILRNRIESMIKDQEDYLASFQARGLEEKDILTFNRARDRLNDLKRFLAINEDILTENRSILKQLATRLNRTKARVVQTISEFVNLDALRLK